MIRGKLSAVNAAIEKGKLQYEDYVNDIFILGNPHEYVFSALKNEYEIKDEEAIGIIETKSIPSILVAADTAVKTAQSRLVKIKMARELGGKAYAIYTGELAAVQASTEATAKTAEEQGKLIETSVIPNPDPKIWETVLRIKR